MDKFDITDSIGELIRTNRAKKFRKAIWINILVVGALSILILLLQWKTASGHF